MSTTWSDKFSSGWATLKLTVSESSQSTANNTTTLKCSLKITKNSSCTSHNSGGATVWMKINGSKIYSGSSFSIESLSVGSTKTLATETITVSHNSDGTKSVSCAAYLKSGVGLGTASISDKTFTCTTIPRASTVTCPSSFTVGTAGTISISRKSTSFTHTITNSLGSSGLSAASKVGTSFTYTPPYSLFNSSTYKSTTKRTGATMTVQTMSGSTKIGDAVSKTFSVTLPQNSSTKPTCSLGKSLTEYGTNHLSKYGVLIAGKSKIQLSGCSASGKYSAEIATHYPTLSGTSCSYSNGVITTGTLTTTSSGKTFSYYVKDTRGFTSSTVTSAVTVPTVVSYSAPQLSVSAKRTSAGQDDAVNGTEITFTVKTTVSKIVQDSAYFSNENKATVKIYLLKYNSSGNLTSRSLVDTGTSLNNISTGTYFVTATTNPTSNSEFSTSTSYSFEVTISDDLTGEASLGSGSQVKVGTAETMLSFYANKGMAIGKVAENEGLEVDWDLTLNGELYIENANLSAAYILLSSI